MRQTLQTAHFSRPGGYFFCIIHRAFVISIASYDASKICSFYNDTQLNDLCVSMPPNISSTFPLNIRSRKKKKQQL